MTLIFRRMGVSLLEVDDIPLEAAEESKEGQESFLMVKRGILHA